MTRLNPITRLCHQLRAEKARRSETGSATGARNRSNEATLSGVMAKKAEIDEMLARLQALSADHFNAHPDEIDWGDVGTLEHYTAQLREITDCAFGEDEYAD